MARPAAAPDQKKSYVVNVRLTADERTYLKAIAMTRKMTEPNLLREVIHDFIEPHRGDPKIEKAKRDALKYGLVPPPK